MSNYDYTYEFINESINIKDDKSIAILIPCYNENIIKLKKCIESAINIDYTNKTIILLDDGSINKEPFYEYSDKIIILTQENKKLPITLHTLFTLSKKFDYLTWGSSDNEWGRSFLRYHKHYLEKNNADITYSDYYVVDDDSKFNTKFTKNYRTWNRNKMLNSLIELPDINEVFCSVFINQRDNFIGASFLLKSDVFDYYINYQGVEDYEFWIRMYLSGKKYYKITTKETLYMYRYHEKSLSAQANKGLFDDKNKILIKNEYINMLCYRNNYICNPPHKCNDFFTELKTNVSNYIKEVESCNTIDDIKTILNNRTDNNWFKIELSKFIDNKQMTLNNVKELLTRDLQINKCTFKYPHVITKKIKILLLAQHFNYGGLENIIDLITGIDNNSFEFIIGSYMNCDKPNIINFDQSIDNVVAYVNQNNIDIIDLHTTVFDLEPIKIKTKVKICFTNHNTYFWFDDNQRQIIKNNDKYIDLYVNVSKAVKNNNINIFCNDGKKSIIIENGINMKNTYDPIKLQNLKDRFSHHELIILCVATIFEDKGQLELIKSVHKYSKETNKNVALILLGNITSEKYRENIQNYLENEKFVSNVYFERCHYEDVIYYYKSANIFMLTSYAEGCSQAVKEAIYYDLPIIVTDTGSNLELAKLYNNVHVIDSPYKIDDINTQDKYYQFLFNHDKQIMMDSIIEKLKYIDLNEKSPTDKYYLSKELMCGKRELCYHLLKNDEKKINLFF